MLERSSSAEEISSGLSGLTDCKAAAETTPFSTRRTSSLSALTLPDYTNQQNHNTIITSQAKQKRSDILKNLTLLCTSTLPLCVESVSSARLPR